VKRFEISVVAATVATHYAIERFKSLDSMLSLLNPSYITASDLFQLMKTTLSPAEYDWFDNHSVSAIFYETLLDDVIDSEISLVENRRARLALKGIRRGHTVYSEYPEKGNLSIPGNLDWFLHNEITEGNVERRCLANLVL
jgi:hypothetical protein